MRSILLSAFALVLLCLPASAQKLVLVMPHGPAESPSIFPQTGNPKIIDIYDGGTRPVITTTTWPAPMPNQATPPPHLPDATTDDSIRKLKGNASFWTFVQTLPKP